ncbi:MAG: penicillin-binding protein activator [Deltaproteobacteria bacterium]|nr:penicillin-binding protein activator [Deltaproteobacteria bacterium]
MNFQEALTALELQGTPTSGELKKAFRRLALDHHPDRNPDNPGAARRFLLILDAYNFLVENVRDIPAPAPPTGPAVVIEDTADIFDDLFGFSRQDRVPGFHEPGFVYEKCRECLGSGTKRAELAAICVHCFGSGRIKNASGPKICPKCGGRGRKAKNRCPACDGFGVSKKVEKASSLWEKFRRVMKNFLLFLVCVSLFSGCATLGLKPSYPAQVDGKMRSEFNAADSHYKGGRYDQALEAYRRYIAAYPQNELTDESHYKIGKIYFIQQNWDSAITSFQTLVGKTPNREYRAKGELLSGHAAYRKGDAGAASVFLDKVKSKDLPAKLQLRLYSLQVFSGQKLGVEQRNLDYFFLRMADVFEESADPSLGGLTDSDLFSRGQVMERLQSFVVGPIPIEKIPAWFHDYPGGFARGYVDYKLAKIYYESGEKGKARSQLSKFVHAYPKHRYADSARKMLTELGGEIKETAKGKVKIGVLLPLSGSGGSFGEAMLRGIRCAAAKQAGCERAASQILGGTPDVELIVRDAGNDPEGVARIVDQLADQDVAAIIGPMSASLAASAAKRAQNIHTVILPITQKAGVMQEGNYVFQMSYQMDEQVKDLASKALGKGLKTFGIFYPQSTYGQEMADRFGAEVSRQGGKVVAKASYNSDDGDLSGAARNLKLAVNRISVTGSGFDALFVPDVYFMMNRIVPALQLVTITGIPLLGTSAWNDPNLPLELFKDYPGSFFLDLYSSSDGRGATGLFAQAFSATYGKTPTSIEAIGFDAMGFLWQAFESAGSAKSSKIRDALLSASGFKGVTGIRSFKEKEGPVVKPLVLTVSETGIGN